MSTLNELFENIFDNGSLEVTRNRNGSITVSSDNAMPLIELRRIHSKEFSVSTIGEVEMDGQIFHYMTIK